MNLKIGDIEEYSQFYILLKNKNDFMGDGYSPTRYPQLVIHTKNREIRKANVLCRCFYATYSYEWDAEKYYDSINIE